MTDQRFALPSLPPSLNNAFVNVPGKGRVRSTEYRRWSEAARWTIAAYRPRLWTDAVVVEIEAEKPKRSRDIDNIVKPALDALTGLAYRDDRQVVDVRARWAAVEGLVITVRQADG